MFSPALETESQRAASQKVTLISAPPARATVSTMGPAGSNAALGGRMISAVARSPSPTRASPASTVIANSVAFGVARLIRKSWYQP